MFGSADQSYEAHEARRKVTRRISYFGVALICSIYAIAFADFGLYFRVNGTYSKQLFDITSCFMVLLIDLI